MTAAVLADGTVRSLWAASARVAPFPAPRLDTDVTADVAVIGGGFAGLSTALNLAEFGRDVVVVEAQAIGYGASGRNGGQVNPGLKLDETALKARFGEAGAAFYRLGQEAPDFLADFVARHRLEARFERPGLVRLAHNAPALKAMHAAADALERQGVAVERLDGAGVERRVGTPRYPGGFVDPRGGSVHPLDLVRSLARAAAGVRIFAGTRATGLVEGGGRWRVATPSGSVTARQVVVVTNAYSDGLIPGLAASLMPVNSFQIATAPLPPALAATIMPGRPMVYDSRRLVLYFRKTDDDRVVLGGRASFISATAVDKRREDYSMLEGVLTGIFPQLAGTPIEHRWTGLVGITRDFLPHYHRPAEGLHVVVGCNGRGVALTHRVGAWLARSLTGRPDSVAIPPAPITPIPFRRFREPLLDAAMQWNRLLDLFGR